jgi:hypothetical protein
MNDFNEKYKGILIVYYCTRANSISFKQTKQHNAVRLGETFTVLVRVAVLGPAFMPGGHWPIIIDTVRLVYEPPGAF